MDYIVKRLRADAEGTDDIGLCAESANEIARLRGALTAIWDKYQAGGSLHEPTTGLAGTLAYMAKDAIAPNTKHEGSA